jgi:FSR family fosmidomycin resistance protein-like MFS transporter
MHFLNDLHPTLLPTFLPEIVSRLSLSLGEAGFTSTLFGVMNLILQPLAGRLADRLGGSAFALYSPLLTAAGAYLLPLAPSYGILLLFVAMMGSGTASFHPQGHGLAGIFAGSGRLGLYVAIFSAAGTLGAALSPLYAVSLLRAAGPRLMPFALIPMFAIIAVIKRLLPSEVRDEARERADGGKPAAGTAGGDGRFFSGMMRVLIISLPLMIISTVRDSSSQGIRVFLPLLITERGGSIAMGGTALFAFTAAGAIANILGGRLSDRYGKIRVIIIMLILAPAFLFPAILLNGLPSFFLFTLGGACLAATNPITLAMAQEYVPESRSTVSSLVMGVSWGLANVVAYPIGILADNIGLTRTLVMVSLSPLVIAAALMAGSAFRKVRN